MERATGLEPVMSALEGPYLSIRLRSLLHLFGPIDWTIIRGGGWEARTPDLLRAKQTLSQLS